MAVVQKGKARSRSAEPLRNEMGSMTREAEMELLFASGKTNEQVWAVMETLYPELCPDDKRRSILAENLGLAAKLEFDKPQREKLGRALRSVKGLLKVAQEDRTELVNFAGAGDVIDLDDIQFDNVDRISCGIAGIHRVFGATQYVQDDPKKPGYGDYTGKVSHGLPRGAISVLGGAEGVGKSRAMVYLSRRLIAPISEEEAKVQTEALRAAGRKGVIHAKPAYNVLYCYGESRREQFKMWTRGIVSGGRFKVSTQILLPDVVQTIRGQNPSLNGFKPDVVIIDSMQMIAEAQSNSGMKRMLAMFKTVAAEVKCQIIMISHLNKQGELKGSRDIAHMVDTVLYANPIENRRGFFSIECPRKNRFGATPRHAMFQHDGDRVVDRGTDEDVHDLSKPHTLVRSPVPPGLG